MSRRGERSAEEREAARREREAKRAAREGRPPPPEPTPFVEEDAPFAEPPAGPATDPHADEHDPHATQQYDVTRDWTGELPALGGDPGAPAEWPAAGEPPAGPSGPGAPADNFAASGSAAGEPPAGPVGPRDPAADEPPAEPAEGELPDVPAGPTADEPPAAPAGRAAGEPPGPPLGPTAGADDTLAHPAAPAPSADPAEDPHATQLHDVTSSWSGDDDKTPPSLGDPGRRERTPLPDVSGPAGSRDRPIPPAAPDWGAEWTGTHDAVDPPSEEHELPLGTRRVGAAQRAQLPHLNRGGRGGRGGRAGGSGRRGGRGGPGAAPGRLRRFRRWLILVLLILAVAVVWFLFSLFQPFAGSGKGTIVITIPRGAGVSQIGDLLADRGVVSSSFFFRARATISGDRGDLHPGTYTMKKDMSYGSALAELTKTRKVVTVPTVRVVVPEGQSRTQTATLVRQDGLTGSYLTASRRSSKLNPRSYGAPRGATLEGFLFPDTYELPRHAAAQQLVDQQATTFKREFRTIDLSYAKSRHLSAFDVVTIASMVEREVSLPRERPLVASVIYNRLRDKMPLGIDATLRFGLNDFTHPLTESELNSNNPYNTRHTLGLPPGPIGSPGLASLKAAAHPATTKYLYYVVRPGTCGETAFSTNYQQFLADAARYTAARARAGGKSPTKC